MIHRISGNWEGWIIASEGDANIDRFSGLTGSSGWPTASDNRYLCLVTVTNVQVLKLSASLSNHNGCVSKAS